MAAPVEANQLAEALAPAVEDWSEEGFLALPPTGRRVELLDGGLLVSPSAGGPHQRLSSRFWYVLERARPDGVEVLEAVNVRVGSGKILVPDLVVVRGSGAEHTVWDAADVLGVVEILGPNPGPTEQAVKPALSAAAGITHYLRIELGPDGPDATVYRLEAGSYREVRRVRPGQELVLTEPIALTVDLGKLLRASRLPD